MYGAILGDIIGSPYEFDFNNIKTKEFPLFSPASVFTDDSVMTIAVFDALDRALNLQPAAASAAYEPAASGHVASDRTTPASIDSDKVKAALVESLRRWGKEYPYAGYGARFSMWLTGENPEPYNSFGNGSAMRVSSVGWLFPDMETTRTVARLTAEVTHNHPEGIKGAESTAAVIFLARSGASKTEIKDYIIKEFGYDLSRSCDEIRPNYRHVESCQGTVPEAITAFLEGESFEDVIRTAVSLGGDCDTLTCIAGGIAEAFYGVPDDLKAECLSRLPDSMKQLLEKMDDLRTKA